MKNLLSYLTGGLVALFSVPSVALDLSLSNAVDMIVSESHDLKKADANLKQAEAQLDAANANRWFKLEGSASYMNMVNVENPSETQLINLPPELGGLISDSLKDQAVSFEIPDNIFQAGVSLTQPIYTFGKIGNAVNSVKSAIKMSKASKEMVLREVKYAAADLYWTAKMTDEIVKLSETDLKNARSAKQKLTSAGRANRSNLLKIESDIATKEINVSDAKFNRDTAYRMLKIMAGIDMSEDLVLTDGFPKKFDVLNAGELKSTPQWDILGEQVNMYEDLARSKRAGAYPTLAATASYSYSALSGDVGHLFDKSGSQSAYWGLALQVPIFSGGINRANATIEAMNAAAATQELEKSKKLTTEQYDNAIKQYNHLRGNLSTLTKARDLAAKTYNLSQNRFGAGQTSAVELADVAAGLYQLDIALLNTKYKILMSAESVKKLGE
ncbi:MAG: TolC family protein [Alphaproteobacteria bacterium]|jgi:multidrug efflux system outer membrane protein|nr:TolC family protein [Alphaproteobacteria bacterium]